MMMKIHPVSLLEFEHEGVDVLGVQIRLELSQELLAAKLIESFRYELMHGLYEALVNEKRLI